MCSSEVIVGDRIGETVVRVFLVFEVATEGLVSERSVRKHSSNERLMRNVARSRVSQSQLAVVNELRSTFETAPMPGDEPSFQLAVLTDSKRINMSPGLQGWLAEGWFWMRAL